MKIKVLLVVMLISIMVSEVAKAQCNINKKTLENGDISYQTDRENIYKNEDLENGVQAVYIGMEAKQLANTSQINYSLIVVVGSSEPKPIVAPRQVTITFTNNTSLTLYAVNIKTVVQERAKVNGCNFDLAYEDLAKIKGNDILSIQVIDNRLNASITAKPYKDLLVEQAQCLSKATL